MGKAIKLTLLLVVVFTVSTAVSTAGLVAFNRANSSPMVATNTNSQTVNDNNTQEQIAGIATEALPGPINENVIGSSVLNNITSTKNFLHFK